MDLGNVAQIASALLSLLTFLYVIGSARSKVSADAHSSLALRVSVLEKGQVEIERDLEHLPDKDAMHRLELRLTEMAGAMEVIKADLRPIAATNSRIQDWIEERAK